MHTNTFAVALDARPPRVKPRARGRPGATEPAEYRAISLLAKRLISVAER
jgi:hypothetical protein